MTEDNLGETSCSLVTLLNSFLYSLVDGEEWTKWSPILERGFGDDDDDSEFDSEAEEERRHAEEERKKAEKARLEFLDTICVFIAFVIILGASAG